MATTLFFDTETTGLKKDNLPETHPKQPMPIQLGMKLDMHDRREVMAANFLIRTEGWVMEPKASEVTGLTNELADAYGTALITGMELFLDMVDNCQVIVAHNINFDVTVIRRAMAVYCHQTDQQYRDPFAGKPLICTMLSSMNLVKALPKRNGQWKWPRLEEAVKFFFNEQLEGAHDALVDVRACARVYYELLDEGVLSGEYRFDAA